MTWVYAAILALVGLFGLGLVVFGLPGLWLTAIAALLIAWLGGEALSWVAVIGAFALVGLGELAEFGASAGTTGRAGGSKRAMTVAVVGGLIGAVLGTAIPIPLLGTLLGACAGAGLGALTMELHAGKQIQPSLQVGTGAAVGRFLGTVSKLVLGVAMIVWLGIDAAVG
jgi:uncharacterized protein YqgC (DUF456 family)